MILKRIPALLLAPACLMLLLATTAAAQSWGYNPIGARSIGMGGTGIAVANGGEVVGSNPALMGRDGSLELTLSVRRRYEEFIHPSGLIMLSAEGDHIGSHLASIVAPLPFQDERITIGLAHSRPVDPVLYAHAWTGGIDVFSPAVSIRLNDRIRFGVAANIWSGSIEADEIDTPAIDSEWKGITPSIDFEGTNFTAGIHAVVFEHYQQHKVHAGIVYRRGFDLTTKGGVPAMYRGNVVVNSYYESFTMPHVASAGVGWTYNNRATFTVDYSYAFDRAIPPWAPPPPDWLFTIQSQITYPPENRFAESSQLVALGSEYLLQIAELVVPIRMGYRSYGTPFQNSDGSQVLGEALSVGAGLISGPFRFDLAYEKAEYLQHVTNPTADEIPSILAPASVKFQLNTFVVSVSVNIEDLW